MVFASQDGLSFKYKGSVTEPASRIHGAVASGNENSMLRLASDPHIDLSRAPYGLYGLNIKT